MRKSPSIYSWIFIVYRIPSKALKLIFDNTITLCRLANDEKPIVELLFQASLLLCLS